MDPLIGKTVGKIRIEENLCQGGMGDVYVGRDETLGRQVAVKVIGGRLRLNSAAKKRFIWEAQVLSKLEHPNICRVYEFIQGDKHDFLVMELIKGSELAEVANAMTFRAKLRVAEQVAEALSMAHRRHIVHRDLKPANVMITDDERVKVLDFGLARSPGDREEVATAGFVEPVAPQAPVPLEGGGFKTELGVVVGTPMYMSPEQARGVTITTASDMYSLGLLLQWLFTGKDPHPRGITRTQLMMRAMDGETAPVEGIDAGLVTLINDLKSITPESRPSAEQVKVRLQWISERPARRMRRAALAAFIFVLVVGTVFSTVGFVKARRSEANAIEARDQAEQLAAFLVDLFQVSDPDVAQGQPVDARELLQAGAERIQRELADQPLRRAQLMFTIAQIDHRIGSWDEAEQLFLQALALEEKHLPPGDLQTVPTLRGLGDLLVDREQIKRAEVLLLRALALVDQDPERNRLERARTMAIYGSLLHRSGRLEEAVEVLEESILILDVELGPDSLELLQPLDDLAGTMFYQRRCAEAEQVIQRQEELNKRLGRGLTVGMARTIMSRAMCLSADDPAGAAPLYRRAVEVFTELLGEQHAYVGDNRGNLGIVYRRIGEYDSAEKELRRAVEILHATRGAGHSHTASFIGELGLLYYERGNLAAAEVELQRSLKIFRQALAPGHVWIAWNLWSLGNVYRDQSRFTEAEQSYLEALAIQEAALPADHPELQQTREDYSKLRALLPG